MFIEWTVSKLTFTTYIHVIGISDVCVVLYAKPA